MRKVILSMSVTLDGFAAGPNGEMDWVTDHNDDEILNFIDQQLDRKGTILLGGVTYRIWSQYWATATGSIAEKLNRIPKLVFSRTMETAGWGNATLVKDNIPEHIKKLKTGDGLEIMLQGGPGIAQTFMQLNLIDEFQLLVYPVLLGKGKPLYIPTPGKTGLELVQTRKFDRPGVVLLHYKYTEG